MGMASDIPTALVNPCPMSIAYRVVKWLLRLDMDIALLDQSGSAFISFRCQLCLVTCCLGWRGSVVKSVLMLW